MSVRLGTGQGGFPSRWGSAPCSARWGERPGSTGWLVPVPARARGKESTIGRDVGLLRQWQKEGDRGRKRETDGITAHGSHHCQRLRRKQYSPSFQRANHTPVLAMRSACPSRRRVLRRRRRNDMLHSAVSTRWKPSYFIHNPMKGLRPIGDWFI